MNNIFNSTTIYLTGAALIVLITMALNLIFLFLLRQKMHRDEKRFRDLMDEEAKRQRRIFHR